MRSARGLRCVPVPLLFIIGSLEELVLLLVVPLVERAFLWFIVPAVLEFIESVPLIEPALSVELVPLVVPVLVLPLVGLGLFIGSVLFIEPALLLLLDVPMLEVLALAGLPALEDSAPSGVAGVPELLELVLDCAMDTPTAQASVAATAMAVRPFVNLLMSISLSMVDAHRNEREALGLLASRARIDSGRTGMSRPREPGIRGTGSSQSPPRSPRCRQIRRRPRSTR